MRAHNTKIEMSVKLRLPLHVLDKVDCLCSEWGLPERSQVIEKLLCEVFPEE